MNPSDIERPLREHAGSLRRLAHALVADPHLAEDLSQETALRALQRPPQAPRSWLQWLKTVTRNAAFKEHRSRTRRQARETQSLGIAHRESPSAAAVAARREMLRGVTDAMLALDEPYQTTLLLRYFEGRSPTEIAQATGVSLATVKSRIARGLALLRGKLARNVGKDWRAGLVAGFGLSSAATAASTTAGAAGAVVSTVGAGGAAVSSMVLLQGATLVSTPKLVAAAGGLVACGLLVFSFTDPQSGPAGSPEIVEPPAVQAAVARAEGPVDLDRREMLVAAPDAVEQPVVEGVDHPFAFEVACLVEDHFGLPAEHREIYAALPDSEFNLLATTDSEGRAQFAFRGKRQAVELLVAVKDHASGHVFQRVRAVAGHESEIAFSVPNRGAVPQEFWSVTRVDAPESAASGCPRNKPAAMACSTCHIPASKDFLEGALEPAQGLHPFASLRDRWSAPENTRGIHFEVSLPRQAATITGWSTRSGIARFLEVSDVFEVQLETPTEDRAQRGVVRSPRGDPAHGAVVLRLQPDGKFIDSAVTGEDGGYAFEEASADPVMLHATRDGVGRSVVSLVADARQQDFILEAGAVVEGQVLDTDGIPIQCALVLYEVFKPARSFRVSSDASGRFRFTNLPGGQGRVLVWDADAMNPLPAAMVPGVYPNGGAVVVQLDKSVLGKSGLRFTGIEQPMPVEDLEVRIIQESSGYGAIAKATPKAHVFELAELPIGMYSVRYGSRLHGWHDAGRVFVDGTGVHDVSLQAFRAPGRLQFLTEGDSAFAMSQNASAESQAGVLSRLLWIRSPDPSFQLAAYREHDLMDLQLTPSGGGLIGSPSEVAAGNYLCLWKRKGGGVTTVRFSVRSGELTVVDVP